MFAEYCEGFIEVINTVEERIELESRLKVYEEMLANMRTEVTFQKVLFVFRILKVSSGVKSATTEMLQFVFFFSVMSCAQQTACF